VKWAYSIHDFEINLIANLYLILFLPGLFLASYWFASLGLRYGLLLGAAMQGVGAFLKYFINNGFWIVYVGQSFWALAQPLFMASPALFATYWFRDSERTIAITIGATSNTIGVAIGIFFPTIFVDDDNFTDKSLARSQIATSLLVQGIIGLGLCLIVLFTFQNKPQIPPSSTAWVEGEKHLFGTYYTLLKNLEFLKLTLSYTMANNNIIVLGTLIDLFSNRHGFSTDDSGLFGSMIIIGGIVSSFLVGVLLAKTQMYKLINVGLGVLTMLALLGYLFCFISEKKALVIAGSFMLGFWAFPSLVVSFDYWSKVTFPLNEATVGGLFQFPAQVVGFIWTIIWTEFVNRWKSNQGITWCFVFLIGWNLIGTIGALLVKKLDFGNKINCAKL
jgi:MFS family permease